MPTVYNDPGSKGPQGPAVPPDHLYRTFVLCFDGTGDKFDDDNSNVALFYNLLKRDNRDKQEFYYQTGIGTYESPFFFTPIVKGVAKVLDEMVAWSLDYHVIDGYRYLVENYRAGDRICLFGFSRGAYTARALSGMLHKVGLLKQEYGNKAYTAYRHFISKKDQDWHAANEFKKNFCIEVEVDFVGVWDTVSSVGIIPRELPFASSNKSIRTFRHALALDEHRAKFRPSYWKKSSPREEKLGISVKKLRAEPRIINKDIGQVLKRKDEDPSKETDVLEVWFAGSHCDVGGGSVKNGTANALARNPLRWMIRECFKAQTGIQFDSNGLRDYGINPDSLYPTVAPRPPALPVESNIAEQLSLIYSIPFYDLLTDLTTKLDENDSPQVSTSDSKATVAQTVAEEIHELKDALKPIYDQLSIKWWMWWILELLPLRHPYRNENKVDVVQYRPNLGGPRVIPKHVQRKGRVNVHRSVKLRMDAQSAFGGELGKYKPKVSYEQALEKGNLVWVD